MSSACVPTTRSTDPRASPSSARRRSAPLTLEVRSTTATGRVDAEPARVDELEALEQLAHGVGVLLGEHLGRHHERTLAAAVDGREEGGDARRPSCPRPRRPAGAGASAARWTGRPGARRSRGAARRSARRRATTGTARRATRRRRASAPRAVSASAGFAGCAMPRASLARAALRATSDSWSRSSSSKTRRARAVAVSPIEAGWWMPCIASVRPSSPRRSRERRRAGRRTPRRGAAPRRTRATAPSS